MHDMSGYKVEKKHAHWEILLDEWMTVMLRYFRISGKDLPYWYNERANVGMLAAAAWRCGYVALEEYADSKRKADNEENYQGRVDLWIGRPESKLGELIEAKVSWINLLNEDFKTHLRDALTPAIADARNTKTGKSLATYGICFIVPWMDIKLPQENVEQRIDDLIKAMDDLDIDIKAWYFPSQFREIQNMYKQIYPGVMIMGKQVFDDT